MEQTPKIAERNVSSRKDLYRTYYREIFKQKKLSQFENRAINFLYELTNPNCIDVNDIEVILKLILTEDLVNRDRSLIFKRNEISDHSILGKLADLYIYLKYLVFISSNVNEQNLGDLYVSQLSKVLIQFIFKIVLEKSSLILKFDYGTYRIGFRLTRTGETNIFYASMIDYNERVSFQEQGEINANSEIESLSMEFQRFLREVLLHSDDAKFSLEKNNEAVSQQ